MRCFFHLSTYTWPSRGWHRSHPPIAASSLLTRPERGGLFSVHGQQRPHSITSWTHSLWRTRRHRIGKRRKPPRFAAAVAAFGKSENIFCNFETFLRLFREIGPLQGFAFHDACLWIVLGQVLKTIQSAQQGIHGTTAKHSRFDTKDSASKSVDCNLSKKL